MVGGPLLNISERPTAADFLNEQNLRYLRDPKNEEFDAHNWLVAHFARLWERINGERHPWDSNPYVWVVEFEKCP